MKTKMQFNGLRRLCATLLLLTLAVSIFPVTALAIQDNSYHDPAAHWISAVGRTNELNANSVVTRSTALCHVCEKYTSFTTWRVPEYTRDGVTALSRNVMYSDGTTADGKGTGTILDGTPGVDAYYTGYHWTKCCCDICGTLNSNGDVGRYNFGKNVYDLFTCDAEFMEELPEEVSYAYADSTYHTATTKGGQYCGFCYGTRYTGGSVLERHALQTEVIPQISNGRFAIVEHCTLCDYTRTSYVAAKSVVAGYYGVADGQPHTLTVSDLSERGVRAQIRYGNSAASCTMTAPPSYTEAGQYAVYYEIIYTYHGVEMTENGVANVWLRDTVTGDDGACSCGCGNPNCGCQDSGCKGGCCGDTGCSGDHSFKLLDTVSPTCLTLGYSRYLCPDCGTIEKRDYENALGHSYQSVLVREATCETEGKLLEICIRCGDVKTTGTPKGEHRYTTHTVKATCLGPGYTVKECEVCGERQITDMANALSHNYAAHTTAPTCTAGGQTVYRCDGCGSSFTGDHSEALGHSWNDGEVIANPSCTGEGVKQYTCSRCGDTRLETIPAAGHTPGEGATCLNPGTCTVCGAVLDKASGHRYTKKVIAPTCTAMGYTIYTCECCGDSYKSDYTDPLGHREGDWIVDKASTAEAEGSRHKACLRCGKTLRTEAIARRKLSAVTDSRGEAVVDGYLVIVTEAKTGKPIANARVMLDKHGDLSVGLPKGRTLDPAAPTTVTVLLEKDRSPVADIALTVSDRSGGSCAGRTDRRGSLTVPEAASAHHGAYIYGYPDGTFGPERSMSRSEAAAVFARLLAEARGTRVPVNGRTGFQDVPAGAWYAGSVQYLRDCGVVYGTSKDRFSPDDAICRGEFVAMAVRFAAACGKSTVILRPEAAFRDVPDRFWAADAIRDAAGYGWVVGYGDGTFRAGQEISRAEAVAVLNRMLGRTADRTYIARNLRRLVTFGDMTQRHWAYYDVLEAANAHTTLPGDSETWRR